MRGADGLATALVVGPILLWLAFHDGGYFPTAWNLGALALLWAVVVALLWRREIAWGRLDTALLLGWAALVAWTWLSTAWSIAPAESVLEGERTLLYLAAAAGMLVVASRGSARATAIAVLAASTVVCGDSLADRLGAVSPLPYNRLGGPVGYWNSLGMLAAAGICLAIAFIAHERSSLARALAGFSVPICAGALYLTFSRGSLLALGLGLAILIAIEPKRRQLVAAALVLVLPCAAVIASEAAARALITPSAPQAAVAADAHRVGIVVLLACAASAQLANYAPRLSASVPSVALRRSFVVALACIVVAAAIVAGATGRLSGAAVRAFGGAPPNSTANLNTHLLSVSGSGRAQMWHVALTGFEQRPILGYGAGTYGRLWLIHRPTPFTVQDAHSLYLETLAELGAVGLVLLVVVLVIPVIAARKVMAGRYIPALTATYVAFVAHAAVDWDWEMPVVIVSAIACGTAIVAAGRGASRPLRRSRRVGGLALAAGCGLAALGFLIGNRDLNAAATAAANGQPSLAARARLAQRWAPWSPDPPRWLATLALDRGDRRQARQLLATATSRDPTDWSLWLEVAAASRGQARTRAMIEARLLDPKGPEVFETALQYGLIGDAGRRPRDRAPAG